MKSQPLFSSEIQTCLVCKQLPAPESSQHLIFYGLQFFSLFYDFRLTIMILMIGYYFSTIIWKCPVCKRQIEIKNVDTQISENLILRYGNCFIMLSKNKFAIVAVIIICLLGLNVIKSSDKKNNQIQIRYQPTWENLIKYCGKLAILDNQVHTKKIYKSFAQQGNWQIKGTYLDKQTLLPSGAQVYLIKMNPTQHPDIKTPDIKVIADLVQVGLSIQKGDMLYMKGYFGKMQSGYFYFHAKNLGKLLGQKIELQKIEVYQALKNSNLRNHS